jgi:signal transduction histidine kinase
LETQARVFDPFFTTKAEGHGLGLGVVRGIVRGLGGAIHVASQVTNPPAEPGAFELGPLEAASGRWRGPMKM